MKKLVLKLATWAFLAGLVFTGMGIWEMIKERNVNDVAEEIDAATAKNRTGELLYATVNGGKLDIENLYEYTLSTKKTKMTLSSEYYAPVLNEQDNSISYVVKMSLEPTIQEILSTANFTGLLQGKAELPEKILNAYSETLPNSTFTYLDATYKPKTVMERIAGLRVFLYLLFGGLIVRILLARNKQETDEQNTNEEPKQETV